MLLHRVTSAFRTIQSVNISSARHHVLSCPGKLTSGSFSRKTPVRMMSSDGQIQSELMESMKSKIQSALDAQEVQVTDIQGDGRHVEIVVVSSQFEGKNSVNRQRMVYKVGLMTWLMWCVTILYYVWHWHVCRPSGRSSRMLSMLWMPWWPRHQRKLVDLDDLCSCFFLSSFPPNNGTQCLLEQNSLVVAGVFDFLIYNPCECISYIYNEKLKLMPLQQTSSLEKLCPS